MLLTIFHATVQTCFVTGINLSSYYRRYNIPTAYNHHQHHHHHDANRSAVASHRCDLSPERFIFCQLQSVGHRNSRVPADLINPVGGRSTWTNLSCYNIMEPMRRLIAGKFVQVRSAPHSKLYICCDDFSRSRQHKTAAVAAADAVNRDCARTLPHDGCSCWFSVVVVTWTTATQCSAVSGAQRV